MLKDPTLLPYPEYLSKAFGKYTVFTTLFASARRKEHVDDYGEKMNIAHEVLNGAIAAYCIENIEASQPQWTPIADIPDEWKNGRRVDLMLNFEMSGARRMVDCFYNSGVWMDKEQIGYSTFRQELITHAMLPICPPKELNGC